MRPLILLSIILAQTATPQSCTERAATFQRFLNQYNPQEKDGPKATIATVERDLGKPSSMRPLFAGWNLLYDYPECQGSVVIDGNGIVYGASMTQGRRVSGEDKKQVKLQELDAKIAALETQLNGLRSLRKAVQDMAAEETSEFVPVSRGSSSSLVAAPTKTSPATPAKSVTPAAPKITGAAVTPSSTSLQVYVPSESSGSVETTATGLPIYTGPRGGRYHYSKTGRKVYEKRR